MTAHYHASPAAALRGNILVEALPAIKTDAQWLEQLLTLPAFDEEQREDDAHIRAYNIAELKDLFIPGDRHLLLARRLDQLIRWGYRKRNPRSPDRARLLQTTYEHAQTSGQAIKLKFDDKRPICSFSLIGQSGMGKSTSTEEILAAYPQYIFHPEDNLFQIVWLKVDCPKNGSVRDLAMTLLEIFDSILGTTHALVSTRTNAYALTAKVSHLAMTHSLGILVLDEMQNLSVKKSGGREYCSSMLDTPAGPPSVAAPVGSLCR